MTINHDLAHYPAWLVAKQDNYKDRDILFLHLRNRFELFDSDAETLENFGVEISRIHPKDVSGNFTVSSAKVYFENFQDLCRKLIENKYTVTIAKEIIIKKL